MKLAIQQPNKSLNKAYLKEKVGRNEIEIFKTNLRTLLSKIYEGESEEHHKIPVSDFLKDTWYKDRYEINTKGRTDFVIHNGKTTNDSVGVIIEVKSPTNHHEMISEAKPNKKAMHELILYYLRERIDANQTEVKQLVITNIWEWYIFDEVWFEKNIFRSKLRKDYESFKLSNKDTKFFFESIAQPFLENLEEPIPCTYFDLNKFEKIVRADNKKDDNKLIALYKLLSPAHLLKQPFSNDSNSLDTKFYVELLHIIGLEEVKNSGKKLIQRKEKPDSASLLENAIMKLQDKDCLRNITNLSTYGTDSKEQLFNVALELCITWINRVLFIKLLEGQLVTYHKGDKDYLFLNTRVVFDYDELNNLFFQVLAERTVNRHEHLKEKFSKVPYLNSSLFDRTSLERQTIEIGALDNRLELQVLSSTVLKNEAGKRKTSKQHTLQYLFDFLDAYDFSSEGGEEIQEENKNLINASVLGLIFEKINGYKDGSFFTPGFVTMYMCRETIRRAVVQKFNDSKGWECETLAQLYDKIIGKEAKVEANTIINSLKICDPAVGSGHFLVSALNEMIAIKSELGILLDRQNTWLRDYSLEVVNDELIITVDGSLLDYNPKNPESRRVQEALFHEKETIIENCLFGVDINPNSVKICRLRLWIELLKNAYYTKESNYTELETLPNIDINIKCGNSLISRFALDADLSKALKKSKKWTIDSYRIAVQTYRNAENKEEKREMEELIESIKTNFRTEISDNDSMVKRLQKLNTEYYLKYQADKLFDAKLTTAQKKDKQKFESDIEKLDTEIKEIKNNKIYENAFEWRFEFPEVLDNEGSYIGFDLVIGNPPYKMIQPNNTSKQEIKYMSDSYPCADFKIDLFHLFFQKAYFLLKPACRLCFIAPSSLLNNVYVEGLREFMVSNFKIEKLVVAKEKVFDDADVHTAIYFLNRSNGENGDAVVKTTISLENVITGIENYNQIEQKDFSNLPGKVWNLLIDENNIGTIQKIARFKLLGDSASINRGLITGDRERYFSDIKINDTYVKILTGADIGRYFYHYPKEYVLFDRPKTSGGCWDREVHFAPFKLCIRQIGTEPTATLIEKPFAVTGNIFTVVHPDKSFLKFCLALINSKLIKYYWQIMFSDFKTSFPQVTIFSLNQIPIPEIANEKQMPFISLVDKISKAKSISFEEDTLEMEIAIDELVYQLYGLTEEEIKIVEGVS